MRSCCLYLESIGDFTNNLQYEMNGSDGGVDLPSAALAERRAHGIMVIV